MATSVDWAGTQRIFVPRADMPIVQASPEIREFDVAVLHTDLRTLEAGFDGMPWTDTHAHEPESTLAGLVYARKVRIIPPYTLEFEDGQYAVSAVGANHNIVDVKIQNQVSLITQNSAGLISIVSAADVAQAVKDIALTATLAGSLGRGVLLAQNVKLAFRIDNYDRDAVSGFANTARLRIFADQADADASTAGAADGADGEIGKTTIQGQPDGTFIVLPDGILGGS